MLRRELSRGRLTAICGVAFGNPLRLEGIMPDETQRHPTAPDGALLDAAGVAQLLGVPTSWVYSEARAGRLPHVRVGRYRRFRRGAVENWIADHEKGAGR